MKQKRIAFAKIVEGPFPDHAYPEGQQPDVAEENAESARIVLQNWSGAATWGLPRQQVADMLDVEAKRLRDQLQ